MKKVEFEAFNWVTGDCGNWRKREGEKVKLDIQGFEGLFVYIVASPPTPYCPFWDYEVYSQDGFYILRRGNKKDAIRDIKEHLLEIGREFYNSQTQKALKAFPKE
jgi:hypothetical protein